MATKKRPAKTLVAALKRIRLFASDVDGVLTDAGMYYSESGEELKKFNTRDGMGIKLLQRAGIITALVTQERTKLVARRGEKLMIPEVHQGVMDKLTLIREMANRLGLSLDEVAYIGDDVNDVAALEAVGFSATPADGMPQAVAIVDYVCTKKGGEGAVREIIEMILEAQHKSVEAIRGKSQ
jgi:YrbI family 3-deoxy-D-manno-octulosonate 8-phosphate phosphatase